MVSETRYPNPVDSDFYWGIPKAAFHFRVFHTLVYARKTLNQLKHRVVEQPHDLMWRVS